MRSLKILTCLAACLMMMVLSSTAYAEFTINDPKLMLDQLRQRTAMGGVSFETAMACGESKPYTAYHSRCEYRCSKSFCQSRCEVASGFEAKFDLHLSECSSDGANIFGDNGLVLPISKTEYMTDGNWVRALLRGAGQFIQPLGEWTVTGVRSSRAARIVGGKAVAIPRVTEVSLELSFGTPGAQTELFFVLIDDSKKGLDQVLGFGEGMFSTSDSIFFFVQRGVVIPRIQGGLF